MNNIVCKLTTLVLCLSPALAFAADPATNLDQLFERVKAGQGSDSVVNRERLEKFTTMRDQQRQLLDEAKQDVARQEEISTQLKESIESNRRHLVELDEELLNSLGNFEELFGVTRQVAGDAAAQLRESIISAQFPGRSNRLTDIARDQRSLPSIDHLRQLWLTLFQEQTQQAKVVRFSAKVNMADGKAVEKPVTRIGPFTAVSDGKYLVYSQETGRLATLARQPAAAYRRSAEQLQNAKTGEIVTATVDPSSGTILSLLVQTPNLLERFHQGGLVGYLVTGLAIIGLLIGVQRISSLWWTANKVTRQMRSEQLTSDNPLGRVLQSYEGSDGINPETLELKLEDAVMKEVPALERGLNTLKVLAAIAPLMGLLGTVIGMILTFQSITLWGTGDPKLMAGGISQALMTTVLGLIAAIPLLLLHSMASGKARVLQQILQEQSAGLVARRAEVAHG